MLLPGVEVQ